MAWIESHTNIIRHRKVCELARELRLRRSHVIGHLHALWHAALEQQDDGDLTAWSDEFIAEMSDFPGDAPQYVRLLQKAGFLDGRLIHDWIDYAGRFLRARYSSSNPDRLVEIWAKHGRIYGGEGRSDKRVTPKRQVNNTHQPNPTNLTQPTMEGCSAAETAAKPAEAVFLEFPCKPATRSDQQTTFAVTETEIAELAETFPAVDVPNQVRRALKWIRANPTRIKTSRGMPDFLYGWMRREQDRPPPRGGVFETAAERRKREFEEAIK